MTSTSTVESLQAYLDTHIVYVSEFLGLEISIGR